MRKFACVERLKATYPVTRLCRVLGVSPSGYWAWRKRAPSRARSGQCSLAAADRRDSRRQSRHLRRAAHSCELRAQGERCSRKRVARLMRLAGVAGCHRRRFRTTRRDPMRPSAPDLVQRAFVGQRAQSGVGRRPHYVPTPAGLPLPRGGPRRLLAPRRRAGRWRRICAPNSSLAALEMALQHRRPAAGVIHHSDHGSQYTAPPSRTAVARRASAPRWARSGDCYDNAMAESFFATLECELLSRSSFPTHAEASTALFDFIEIFSNRQRRHSALGYSLPRRF